jgi:hypothetical protein
MEDNLWNAEFIGLFWGEGCADIQKFNRHGRGDLYRPRLRISLRSDDKPLLVDIQSHLGGTLTGGHGSGNYKFNTMPSVLWCVSNKESVLRICDILLSGKMPAKKLKQIRVVRMAAKLRAGKSGHLTERERLVLDKCYRIAQHLKKFK